VNARTPYRTIVVLLVLATACTAWALVCLRHFRDPYLLVLPSWLLACVVAAFAVRRPWARAAFVNAAALLAVLWAFEWLACSAVREADRDHLTYSHGYWEKDPALGGVPKKGIVGRSKRTFNDTVVYDVAYTIGPDGLRVSPPVDDSRLRGCALFFGCSFTFGEGLDDDQAMPWRVGVRTNGEYRIHNFGFHGYGPHHMLAALESGFVERTVKTRPTHAVCQAVPEPAAGTAGGCPGGRHRPGDRLAGDGSVKRDGFLDDGDSRSRLVKRVRKLLAGSGIWAWNDLRMRYARDEEIDLFVGIVRASERAIREKFPGCRFHVILWRDEQGEERFEKTLRGLRNAGITVHRMDDILPGYASDPRRYDIGPHDRHPNALANDLIAAYVVREILGRD
jgi:hypothetical protein